MFMVERKETNSSKSPYILPPLMASISPNFSYLTYFQPFQPAFPEIDERLICIFLDVEGKNRS
jgi:hypothetical protein